MIGVTGFTIGHEHVTGMLVVALVSHVAPSAIPIVVPRFAELLICIVHLGSLDGRAMPFRRTGWPRR